MASGPITSWQIDGETVETVADFIFLGSKLTADGDCSYEIKRRLLLGRKVMTNLDSILKSRDITLPTKVHLVKAMVFPKLRWNLIRPRNINFPVNSAWKRVRLPAWFISDMFLMIKTAKWFLRLLWTWLCPLPLPQSPKDCSIHQCLFCCLVHRVIVTIFLNSIYMR